MFSEGGVSGEKDRRGERIGLREKESEKAHGWISALFSAHVPNQHSSVVHVMGEQEFIG